LLTEVLHFKNPLSFDYILQIYNTYGLLSNAALLHRYGFTEPDNPFDIVNVDLVLVIHVCGGLSSKRHVRRCLTLWRQAGCAPCSSQGTEYFEFSVDGKPQSELLLLLYLIHAPDATRDNVEQQALHWNAGEVELSDDEEIERVSSAAVDKLAKALGWTTKLKNSSRYIVLFCPSSFHYVSFEPISDL